MVTNATAPLIFIPAINTLRKYLLKVLSFSFNPHIKNPHMRIIFNILNIIFIFLFIFYIPSSANNFIPLEKETSLSFHFDCGYFSSQNSNRAIAEFNKDVLIGLSFLYEKGYNFFNLLLLLIVHYIMEDSGY